MSVDNKLSLRELISESLIRDVILFLVLFLLILAQGWVDILLLIFPLITFAFSFFFRMLSVNKWRIKFINSPVIYNPFGIEKKHADRFTFTSLLQLVFLFWIGAESIYHPQLIDNYNLIFVVVFVFIFTFGFFWIFVDLWKFTKLEILFDDIEIDSGTIKNDPSIFKNLQNVVSFLKLERFKIYSIFVFLIFITLNFLNLYLSFLTFNEFIPGMPYYLPGTGIEDSGPISLNFVIYATLITSPISTIVFLTFTYKNINSFDSDRLSKVVKPLPKYIQTKIFENLKVINKRFKEELSLE